MKIGILTLPIAENYGGILQAVALYRLLHNQGHDVVLIYKKITENIQKIVTLICKKNSILYRFFIAIYVFRSILNILNK